MAHFARIENNIVIERHVVANAELLDDQGLESEYMGQTFLADLWGGNPDNYIQVSYNGNLVYGQDRGVFPGIGYLWDGTQFRAPNDNEEE